MKEVKHSKKARSAQGANLCPVKCLPPKRSSRGHIETQHRLHPKSSYPNVRSFNKSLAWYVDPQRGKNHLDSSKGKLSCIAQIQWKCPPEFALDIKWRVAAGEESEEVEAQNDRKPKAVEEVYSGLSENPSSPSVSLNEEDQFYDDSHTPIVPTIPIEELEAAAKTLVSDFLAAADSPRSSAPLNIFQVSSASETEGSSHCASQSPTPFSCPSTSPVLLVTSQPPFICLNPHTTAISKCIHEHPLISDTPSVSIGPSIYADLPMKSQTLTLIQDSPNPAAPPDITEHSKKKLWPQFVSHIPSTSANSIESHQTMDSKAQSVYQQRYSETTDISQSSKLSQPRFKSRASSKFADLSIPKSASLSKSVSKMNSQPPSVSQQPFSSVHPAHSSAKTQESECTCKSQPPSPSQGPTCSTSTIPSHDPSVLQTPLAGEDSSIFHGLDSDTVGIVTAVITSIRKSKEQGSLINTDLLLKLLSDPEMIEKLMKDDGLAANTRTETSTACDLVPSSVPFPSSRTNFPAEKPTNVHNDSPDNGMDARSRPVIASTPRPLPSTKSDALAIQSVQEHKTEAISTPVNGRCPISLPSNKPEVLRSKSGTALENGSNAEAISASMPGPEHGMFFIEKLMKDDGWAANTRTETTTACNPVPSSIPLPSSQNNLPAEKATTNVYNESPDNGTNAISGPVISNQSCPLPSAQSEALVFLSVLEHKTEAISTPVSGRGSISLPSKKSEVLQSKSGEENVVSHSGFHFLNISGHEDAHPFTSSDADAATRLIRQIIDALAGTAPMNGSTAEAIPASMPLPEHGESSVEKLMKDDGLAANTGIETTTASNPLPSSLPLPSSPSNLPSEKASNLLNDSPDNGNDARSRPVISSQPHPFPSTQSEDLASQSVKENKTEAISTPVSGRGSIPLPSKKPEVLDSKSAEENVGSHSGSHILNISGHEDEHPFTSSDAYLATRQLTDALAETTPVNGSNAEAIPVSMPCPERGESLIGEWMKDDRLAANTRTETTTASDAIPSSVPLPSSLSNLPAEKATNVLNGSPDKGIDAGSTPVISSQPCPLPSTQSEDLACQSVKEHITEAISTPVSGRGSISLPRKKPGVLQSKSGEEYVGSHSGSHILNISGHEDAHPFTSSDADAASSQLTDALAETAPVNGSNAEAIPASMPRPEHGESLIEKLMKDDGLAANTRTETTTACDPLPSSVPLPSLLSNIPTEKATNVLNDSPDKGIEARSRPVISSLPHPFPSAQSEALASQSVKEHKVEAISTQVSGGCSIPLPSKKPEVLESKSGTVPENGSNVEATPASMPCPEHGVSLIQSSHSSKRTIRPLCGTQARWRPEMSSEFHAMSSSKVGVAGNNWIEEKGLSNAAPFGYHPKPVAMPVPLSSSKPEFHLGKTFNEYNAPAHIPGILPMAPLIPCTSRPKAEMMKKLIHDYGGHEHAMQNTLPLSEHQMVPFPRATSDMVVPPGASIYTMPTSFQPNLSTSSHSPFPVNVFPMPTEFSAPPPNDVNYYQPPAMQHGEWHEHMVYYQSNEGNYYNQFYGPQFSQGLNPTEHSARQKKPCMYFHTLRGCRNGSNCSYLHDTIKQANPGSVLETPGAKRVKLSGELAGRM